MRKSSFRNLCESNVHHGPESRAETSSSSSSRARSHANAYSTPNKNKNLLYLCAKMYFGVLMTRTCFVWCEYNTQFARAYDATFVGVLIIRNLHIRIYPTIPNPTHRVVYKRQSNFFAYQYHEFLFVFGVLFIRTMRSGLSHHHHHKYSFCYSLKIKSHEVQRKNVFITSENLILEDSHFKSRFCTFSEHMNDAFLCRTTTMLRCLGWLLYSLCEFYHVQFQGCSVFI